MKAFCLKEIRTVVLQGHRDNLIVIRTGHGLGVDNYSRSGVICNVVGRRYLISNSG